MKATIIFLVMLLATLLALPAFAINAFPRHLDSSHQARAVGIYSLTDQAELSNAKIDLKTGRKDAWSHSSSHLLRFKQKASRARVGAVASSEGVTRLIGGPLAQKPINQDLENKVLMSEVQKFYEDFKSYFQIIVLLFVVLVLLFFAWGFSLKRAVRRATESYLDAKNRAEAANRSKSEFLSIMSHELRTPLNSIIGFSEVLKNESFGPLGNEKYLEYVGYILSSGQHLLSVISDVLDLSKIEAGKTVLNEQEFDPHAVIRSSVTLVMGQARSQHIDIVMEVSEQLELLRGDQRALMQILVNLLSNAVKFTPDGGKVTLRAWSRRESGHVFQVIDTGIGVALNDVPKILKPFTQIDSSLNRKYQGTGLGLPLVKELVELHGGVLDFQSELGSGSIVTVRFPKERIAIRKLEADYISAA
jgi:signal transduction histidine kinase